MEGHAKVAQLMASQPEFAIVRRFRVLNMQRLLYLQAEITHLEEELSQLMKRDAAHEQRHYHSRDWWSLSQGGESEEDFEQWQKVLEISEKLDEYNDVVLKQASLSKLEAPRQYDLRFIRTWFQRPGMGAFPLLGLDRDSWDVKNESDLVAISPRTTPDTFSRWFSEDLVPRYHHIFGNLFRDPIPETVGTGTGIYHYRESSLESFVNIITTVMSSLLPICSVVALYLVQSNNVRLGLIALFSACFSLALALMTNARRIEVFAATAAFAAVNVVFLTNSLETPVVK